METGTHLVFVDLNTDTVADCGDAFVIDPDTAALAPGEIDVLDAADTFGAFDDSAAAIVRRVGVPVADLWAAYEWRRAMATAEILADVEHYVVRLHGERAGDDQDYDNVHRCTDCGVTGGGVSDGVCQDCDGERQRNAGDGCPVCGSDDVTGHGWIDTYDGATVSSRQPVTCDTCRASWDDVYRIVGRDNIRSGGES